MGKILLTEQIVGMTAMSQGGAVTGTVDDLVIDTETGEIRYLLIRTSGHLLPGKMVDGKGRMVVAYNNVVITGSNLIFS